MHLLPNSSPSQIKPTTSRQSPVMTSLTAPSTSTQAQAMHASCLDQSHQQSPVMTSLKAPKMRDTLVASLASAKPAAWNILAAGVGRRSRGD
jgi:hypothetical protein